jgi:ATP-dependent helicase/nuclease subunit B
MTRLFDPNADGPAPLRDGAGRRFLCRADRRPSTSAWPDSRPRPSRGRDLVANARMLRRLQALYLARSPGFLPRLRTVASLSDISDLAGLDPPMPPLRLRLKLADLVRKLIDADPGLAPRAAIYPLADSLADLMGEMFEERVRPRRSPASTWVRNRATGHEARPCWVWSTNSSATTRPLTAEARQARLVDRLTRQWREAPPDHPVLIAGSTGSRGATARLMDAVSRLPQGAVLLARP